MKQGSPLEYALLGLLRQKPQSGYDLRKTFATTPMRHFSDSPGSIYPALQRLEKRRWVTSAAEGNNARKRQLFTVTAAGTRALIDWLRSPCTREDVIWRLDELILRFAFLDGNVDRSAAVAFLEGFEQVLASYVRELREHDKQFDANLRDTTGYLAFKSGVDDYQTRLVWARSVLKKFEEELR